MGGFHSKASIDETDGRGRWRWQRFAKEPTEEVDSSNCGSTAATTAVRYFLKLQPFQSQPEKDRIMSQKEFALSNLK